MWRTFRAATARTGRALCRIKGVGKTHPDRFDRPEPRTCPLPTQLDPEDEEAKRFDVLMLNLQLAVLRSNTTFQNFKSSVRTIATLLEDKSSIPMVQQQMPLIQEIQTDDWWQDVTPQMLNNARKRLRLLVKLIDKQPAQTDLHRFRRR